MDWLTAKINKHFGEKFSFLKLLEIIYNKANNTCAISFLYPENKTLTEEDKKNLINFIMQELNLSAKVFIKFKKSWLDKNLVENGFTEIIKQNYPSACAFIDYKNLVIDQDFSSNNLSINIDEEFLSYIDEEKFKRLIKIELEKRFCSEFFITINKIKIEKELLSESNSSALKQKVPRYGVEPIRSLFGGDLSPSPEYIKNIKNAKPSVLLAGKIENFEKKSYEAKKGKAKGQIKFYYAFNLNDTTNKIEVRYFTTKTNEKQMDKLLDGDQVLIMGDVEEFNRKLTLYIRAITRCKLPEKIEFTPIITDGYEIVFPENYSIISQENLFKKAEKYSEEIMKKNFVVFDVETTGLDYQTDELLEIGAVKVENGRITSKFQSLIKPKSPIPIDATAINNITDQMVANSPSVDIVIRDFYRYTRGASLVGYNVSFDQKFIMEAAKKQSLIFDNEFIDALPLARQKLRLGKYRLVDVVKRLEIDLEGAHRALADALATAEAFLKLNSSEFD